MESIKIGLALEGGGMRGMYTAGVLDVFMENDITFDAAAGVSAGAIHGCTYKARQRGRNLRYYKKYCNDSRFISIRNLITTGDIVGEEFCYHEIPEKLDKFDYETYKKNSMPFYAVCSNIETGKAEYIRINEMRKDIEILRASASLPYFSKPVIINGRKYLDGGCTDSIPFAGLRKMGIKYNVAVLTRDITYRKSEEMKILAKLFYIKYPEFTKALLGRHIMYNNTLKKINRLEKSGDLFVIRPHIPLEIGRLEKDPAALQRIYDIGYTDAKKNLGRLKKWIAEKKNI